MRKVIDIEGVIGSRQSKKDPQYNDQEKKIVEKTHIDLQDTTQKTIIKIEQHEPHTKNWGRTLVLRNDKQFLLH
jgi:hypothetical protein